MSLELIKHSIVPLSLLAVFFLCFSVKDDVLEDEYYSELVGNAPKGTVEVMYSDEEVKFKDTIDPAKAHGEPHLNWEANSDVKYTMIMTDLDPPSRENPKNREWFHWLKYNIPGDDLSGGETLIEYMPPTPPSGTGKHRYLFLIYKQKESLQLKEPKIGRDGSKGRSKRNSKEFASNNGLDGPLAVGMFFAQAPKETN
ncbi:OV-16 antigen [Thelohanellus kitauei]|uniref:OV-16 antigen n=1 Tax=Thelohanellus kitauei TaxID=669202 RepID=A0A0C2IPL2_THEKT|nr:OV-16 antigen [Thelohanellus kitauei]